MGSQPAPSLGPAEIAATQKSANDWIARGAQRFGDERTLFEFFCECGGLRCHDSVWLTVAGYRVQRPGAVIAHGPPGEEKGAGG
jgi:hypothetical protein